MSSTGSRLRGALAVLPLGAALAACLPDFAPAAELGDAPRILSLRAEPPEAAPGEVVTLDVLGHWPTGAPSFTWLVCRPTALDTLDTCVANRVRELRVVPPCESPDATALCLLRSAGPVAFTVPALPLDPETQATALVIELLATTLPGGIDACSRAVTEVAPDADCLLALKSLPVTPREPRNRNPVIAALRVGERTVDGTEVIEIDPAGSALEDLAVTLEVSVDATAVDDWEEDEAGERYPLWLHAAWFHTCGGFDPDDGEGTLRCDPPDAERPAPDCEPHRLTWKPGASGDCTLYVVVRDGRGGVDQRALAVRVR